MPLCLDFFIWLLGKSNSGPYDCMASTLATELSPPDPTDIFLISSNWSFGKYLLIDYLELLILGIITA